MKDILIFDAGNPLPKDERLGTHHNLSSYKIISIGIEPEIISLGTELSKKVKANINKTIFKVLQEILPEKEILKKGGVKLDFQKKENMP